MQCLLQQTLLAICIKNLLSLGHYSKGEQRMKVGYQSRHQMLNLGLYCINPPHIWQRNQEVLLISSCHTPFMP